MQIKMLEPDDLSLIISSCRPPPEVQFYFPPADVIFHTKGKLPQRNIFQFQPFSPRELEKIKRLKLEILKSKLKLPPNYDDSELLKFIYGSGFKTKKALNALKSNLQSRSETFPSDFLLIYPKIFKILVTYIQRTGPLYMHGRDCYYRPLMIMNFSKFDLKKVN